MAAPTALYGEAKVNFAADMYRGKTVPAPHTLTGDGLVPGVEPKRVQLYDGRKLPRGLVHTGYDLVEHGSAVSDFYDDAEVEGVYYDEVRKLVAEATGCQQVIVLEHQRRNGQPPKAGWARGKGGIYGGGVHCDLSPATHRYVGHPGYPGGPGKDLTPVRAAIAGKHYAVFNVWRSTAGEVESWPLALCDMSTVAASDMVYSRGPGIVPTFYRLAHSPQQRLCVFPRMTAREILIFKQYDTREERLSHRQVFHSAVPDPKAAPGARQRESIEVRVVAVFGSDPDTAALDARRRAEVPVEGRAKL